MGIVSEILALMRTTHDEFKLPKVAEVYVPPVRHDKEHADFGLVVLEDGSAGLFYVAVEESLSRLLQTTKNISASTQAWTLASQLCASDMGQRALAFGAVSAITQHFFTRVDYPVANQEVLDFTPADHVGMVGFFPTLVDRLRERNVPLTVIEKQISLVQTDRNFQVSLDYTLLGACNKILCTAATLLNDTIDDVLSYCRKAKWVSIIGPSAGCLPDPLFMRGIHAVGGSQVTDAHTLLARMQADEPWRDSVKKYTILASDYPGYTNLRARISP